MNRFADARLPLNLPPQPGRARRPGVPVLATLAPVAAAGLMFAITRSPLTLAFAAIGPLVGIASLLDGVRAARRERRRALRERDDAIARLELEIAGRHRDELEAAWRRTPPLEELANEPAGSRWLADAQPELVLGAGTEPSALRLGGDPGDERDRELIRAAARLEAAPVLVGLDGGIGFVGPELLARAAARAVVARCAIGGMPGELRIAVPTAPAWSWAEGLPHRVGERTVVVIDGQATAPPPPGSAAIVAVARDRDGLPPGLGAVVQLHSARAAVLQELGDPRGGREFVPELLGELQAGELAARLDAVARRNALGASGGLPDRVELAGFEQPVVRGRSSLAAVVGTGPDGPLVLDLVADGPHALVGGTTGSGKSEFLLAWIAALAAAHPPERLAVLLVDFKGGAAFAPVAALPHVTGIVTDLDEVEAKRAVESLRAESRRRERVLRAHGARDIAELDDDVELARLVIVVDEFQALLDRFAELGDVVADIAARGRSLGMHLVLATQRPNGVVREQISANCRLRICLRVLQPGDSRAVVGVPDAARIPPALPGRAVVDRGDGAPQLFQSGLADPLHLELLLSTHASATPARRPWLDPLPATIAIGELDDPRALGITVPRGSPGAVASGPAGGAGRAGRPGPSDAPMLRADGEALPFGVVDDPAEQRRQLATWQPIVDGPLLVLGTPGSGTTTAAATIARAFAARHGRRSVEVLPDAGSAAWDLLERWSTSTPTVPRLLVVDRLDQVFRSWPDEYRIAGEAMLESVLRRMRGGEGGVVATAGRLAAIPAALRDGFGVVLPLRQASRADLVQLGGDPALWRADERPGAGQWRGRRVQIASGALLPPAPAQATPELAFEPGRRYALVTANVRADLERLGRIEGVRTVPLGTAGDVLPLVEELGTASEGGARPTAAHVVVGDADSWTAAWQLWGAMRHDATVLVHGGLAELRTLVRDRALPPLNDPGDDRGWLVEPGGRPVRYALPSDSTESIAIGG